MFFLKPIEKNEYVKIGRYVDPLLNRMNYPTHPIVICYKANIDRNNKLEFLCCSACFKFFVVNYLALNILILDDK